jgi:hypothetical protein
MLYNRRYYRLFFLEGATRLLAIPIFLGESEMHRWARSCTLWMIFFRLSFRVQQIVQKGNYRLSVPVQVGKTACRLR